MKASFVAAPTVTVNCAVPEVLFPLATTVYGPGLTEGTVNEQLMFPLLDTQGFGFVVTFDPLKVMVTVLPLPYPVPVAVTEVPTGPDEGVRVKFEAATYGPTKGPPLAFGGAPAGSIEFGDVSTIARARLSRPLPVCVEVPTGSASAASRLTITPLPAPTDEALIKAAAPATSAAAADVPVKPL